MKVQVWSESERKKILLQRLQDAKKSRAPLEERWRRIENSLRPIEGHDELRGLTVPPEVLSESAETGDPEIGTNFILKNLRFLHSQMSSNPPVCSPKPTSYDPADREAADAADRIARWGLRAYEMHEISDLRNLSTLTYGSGFTKSIWNPNCGDFLQVDEEGNMSLEGDYELSSPNIWDIYLDADARTWKDVKFVFEKIRVPWTEAAHKWPQHIEQLKKFRTHGGEGLNDNSTLTGTFNSVNEKSTKTYDSVELYEYYETGLPSNGYQGRYTLITADGYEIEPMRTNPETYKAITPTKQELTARIEEGRIPIGRAVLPYDILTDIDDLDRPWGISTVEFAIPLQENMTRLDSCLLQTADANGVPRLLVPAAAELAKGSIMSTPYDIVKYNGNIPPDIMAPAPLSQVVTHLRMQMKNDIDEVMGVNQAMFGQQSREQSGYSQSYSVNQGNLIRQRLFNKYVRNSERQCERFLVICANKWTTPRIVKVIGDENSIEVRSFRGAQILHGFDVTAEFSSSLSLDPMTRRTEIINMWPIFKEAGVDQKKLISLLKMSELGAAYDLTKIPENRMKSYIRKIIDTGVQQQPREKEDHASMLAYAKEYVMLEAFAVLEEPIKRLIEEHMTIREDMLKSQVAEMQAPAAPAEEAAPPPDLLAGPPVGLF